MSEILFQRSAAGVATLTLNRPHRKNAVPPGLWVELQRRFQEVSESAEDRVLVVTGAGAAFCAGADLAEMPQDTHPMRSMLAVNAAALALQSGKRLLSNALSIGLAEALDAEAAARRVNLTSARVREGVAAFLEKRKPMFHGR